MNDLELVRDLRAEVPAPAAARLASGRSRLLAAVSPEQAGFPGRPARADRRAVKLLSTAAAVAVVAGLAGYGIAASVRGPAAPATSPTAAPRQATLAARILRAASAAAGRAPATAEPSPLQWVFAQTVGYDYNTGNLGPGCRFVHGPTPGQTQKCEEWTRFDGNANAYLQGRHLVETVNSPATIKELKKWNRKGAPGTAFTSPMAAYEALAALPRNPRALLAAVNKAAHAVNPGILRNLTGRGSSLAGDYLMLVMWDATGGIGGPPAAEAAAFRALAALPEITVQQGITDIAGAPAIGVRAGYEQLLLDPVSYQVIGLREFNAGSGPNIGWPKHGGLVISMAYTQIREVSGPGIR